MIGPRLRRAFESPVRRKAARFAAPGGIVAGLVATGLALAALPSPTSASSGSAGAALDANPPATSAATAPGVRASLNVDTIDLDALSRESRVNRSASRADLTGKSDDRKSDDRKADDRKPDLEVTGTRYTTVALNVRTKPDGDAKLITVLKPATLVKITDQTEGQWRLIVRDGKGRWVKNRYLAKNKPKLSATSAAISSAPCKSGSGMESGLTSDAIKVHRALCARYPQVTSFGGIRRGDGGEHGSGRAVDAMISNSSIGWQMANWLRAHAKRLGVSQVIYSQHIWTVQRGGEGWRSMSDRGSATANHYDHVHITVYGNAAG